jgi:hypothetical protein
VSRWSAARRTLGRNAFPDFRGYWQRHELYKYLCSLQSAHHETWTPAVARITAHNMARIGALALVAIAIENASRSASRSASPADDVALAPIIIRITTDDVSGTGALAELAVPIEGFTGLRAGAGHQKRSYCPAGLQAKA